MLFLSINATVLIQQPFLPDVPFIHATEGSLPQPHTKVNSKPKYKLQFTPEDLGHSFWWGKNFPEAIKQVYFTCGTHQT